MTFQIKYANHSVKARKLLLEKKLASADALATMSDSEVEDKINEFFTCYWSDPDWLCIEQKKMAEFNRLATWIER
ncbi:MAG: hypothetical protein HDQ88_08275 [Clostridia bacterium]|nr:hypothetical protein [Clostridia bacterium]